MNEQAENENSRLALRDTARRRCRLRLDSLTPEARAFLAMPLKPQKIHFEEVSWISGRKIYSLRILVRAGHLKTGKHEGTCRTFLTSYIVGLADDELWQEQADEIVYQYNHRGYLRRKKKAAKLSE